MAKMFTDEMLAENFNALSKFSDDVVGTLSSLTTLAERTEIRLSVLEKMAARPVVVKNSKLLVLTAMGISFYAGYKYAMSKVGGELEYQQFKAEELKRNQADHPAGSHKTDYTVKNPRPPIPDQHDVTINGSNDPRPES